MIPSRTIGLLLALTLTGIASHAQTPPALTDDKSPDTAIADVLPDMAVGMASLPDSIMPNLPPIEGRGVNDTMLPLRIPGYELRVLDVRKRLLYNIKGSWVEASLPVYFYFPTEPANKERALQLLRQTYDDVMALGDKPQWSAAEFRNLLVSLDAALTLLESSEKPQVTAGETSAKK